MFDKIDKGQWWDRALTLVEGCTPVSEGCDNCWSAAMGKRFGTWPEVGIRLREDRLALPLKTKEPTAWAVWNDLFHEDVAESFIVQVFLMMQNCPQHLFLILTKRPANFLKMFKTDVDYTHPPKNIWLGVTAENQKQADKRIPILLQIPAAVRFVSVEPMLGPVDLQSVMMDDGDSLGTSLYNHGTGTGLDWVICGGESGPKARPMRTSWARVLKNQCHAANMPFFFKQIHVDGKLVKAPELDGKQYLELPTTVRG